MTAPTGGAPRPDQPGRSVARRGDHDGLVWLQVFWPRPLTEEVAVRVVRAWASDQRSPLVILEAQATTDGVRYLVGSAVTDMPVVREVLMGLCPDAALIEPTTGRADLQVAGRLHFSTRHRALATKDLTTCSRSVLAALSRVRSGEALVLQVLLGPRRIPLAIPNNSPSSIIQPWYQIAWYGNGGVVDGERRSALRAKVAEHGFAASVRLGVAAGTSRRRSLLLLGLMAALRTSEAPGLQMRLRREASRRLLAVAQPWRWPLRLGVHEVLALAGWPIATKSDDDLPGLPAAHPKPLPPRPGAALSGRVVAHSSAPGTDQPLRLSIQDQRQHLWVLGPTGVGKSNALASLVLQDIAAGYGAAVIDPKGDLVDDILARVPAERRDDIVVLDPSDMQGVVGLNPLAGGHGRRPEVVADGLLAVFHELWSDSWGPRTQDILHSCLLTLTKRPGASLVMLPLLLTNPAFRRPIVQQAVAADPIALGPFWAWYERLSDGERAAVIAPVMNKLRAFLLRPSIRAVLGQVTPKFSVRQVFTERKVLLVSLNKGLVGPEAAALVGSLVVAELWQSTLERAAVPAERRRPVHIVVDEVQDYLHLPTDLSDGLAQARGLGVGFTLAHQFVGQLPPAFQAALLANARSRICFALPQADAVTMAKGHPELSPEDLTALGRYEVYASLLSGGTNGGYVSGKTLPLAEPSWSPVEMRSRSRAHYGRPLDEIEASFSAILDTRPAETAQSATGRRRVKNQSGGPRPEDVAVVHPGDARGPA